MKIVVLALLSDDVSEELREIRPLFEDALAERVANAEFDSAVQTIFFTPIITRPGIGPFSDKISYLRREPAIHVSININHHDWVGADKRDRINLVAGALLTAVQRAKDSKLDVRTKAQLNALVEEARDAVIRQISC